MFERNIIFSVGNKLTSSIIFIRNMLLGRLEYYIYTVSRRLIINLCWILYIHFSSFNDCISIIINIIIIIFVSIRQYNFKYMFVVYYNIFCVHIRVLLVLRINFLVMK